MEKLTIYHGSKDVIEKPIYHLGNPKNDYGYGFYCTQNIELAKEWSCANNERNGYVNKYTIDTSSLSILNLTDKNYSILNWMAILLKHRSFDLTSKISIEAKDYLIKNFYIDVASYDIVIGYRADDAYFTFAKDFVNNTISVKQLSNAMKLGELGLQIVIISEKAFKELHFEGFEEVNHLEYYSKRLARDNKARNDYLKGALRKNTLMDDIYIIDIIRKGIKNGDPRL